MRTDNGKMQLTVEKVSECLSSLDLHVVGLKNIGANELNKRWLHLNNWGKW